jgi:hypothetical protein
MTRLGRDRSSQGPTGWAARAAAHEASRRAQGARAALVVADRASDAADCRELLDMLGLAADDSWTD